MASTSIPDVVCVLVFHPLLIISWFYDQLCGLWGVPVAKITKLSLGHL